MRYIRPSIRQGMAPTSLSTSGFLKASVMLWSIAALLLAWFLLSTSPVSRDHRLYLIPWCFALAAILLAPSTYLFLRGKFDIFHPIVYPVFTYFLPGFVLGGLVLSFGYSDAFYIPFIQDEHYSLQLTLFYVILAFGTLTIGFASPVGVRVGRLVLRKIPSWEINDREARKGGLTLLTLGFIGILVSLEFGTFGYQRPEEQFILSGILGMSPLLWWQACFLLSLNIFRPGNLFGNGYLVFALLVVTAISSAILGGSRGALFLFSLPIIAGYFYSGRKIYSSTYAWVCGLATIALLVGVIYGTTFRTVRGGLESVDTKDYVASVPATIEKILETKPQTIWDEGVYAFGQRLDLVSSLAVVVSNYEALAPYEEEFGLDNNIIADLSTFFIPRFLWKEKPVPFELSMYGALYFSYSENAFSITPVGDLLRNFGPLGIPIGMFLLGCLLRTLYVSLVDGLDFSYIRLTVYFMLLTSISYDSTYGGIVPHMLKTGIVTLFGFLVIRLATYRPTPTI